MCEPCSFWIRRLVGHVAYVSTTLWVTDKPSCLTIPTPFATNVEAHEAEETGKEVAQGGRRWGGGACRFVIMPKQMLLLKSL